MSQKTQERELLKKVIRERNVKVLTKWLYPNHPKIATLMPDQWELIKVITFREFKQVTVSWPTRSGKTWAGAIGVSNFQALNTNKRNVFIGPQQSQANTLRDYMAELITSSPYIQDLLEVEVKGVDKLKKEVSKKRVTFPSTNVEYEIFSAHGGAQRLMGKGVDGVMILDERDLIEPESEAKISRMRGDNPEDNMIVELLNPWGKHEVAREHWDLATPYEKMKKLPLKHKDRTWEWCKFHMDWRHAVKHGRLSYDFVMSEKKDRTKLEFQVLYESRFPDEAEEQLISRLKILAAEDRRFHLNEELLELERKLLIGKLTRGERENIEVEISKFTRIIACDPADRGKDWTVIMWGVRKENLWQVVGWYAEPKSDSMKIAGRIAGLSKSFIGRKVKGLINIDYGFGVGPISRMKELKSEWKLDNIQIMDCQNGSKAIDSERYVFAKDENFYRLADIFENNFIDIPELPRTLRIQLIGIKWDQTSSDRRKIQSKRPGEKSPDWADCLMYFVWKNKPTAYLTFGKRGGR